jgi:hypothetical protein
MTYPGMAADLATVTILTSVNCIQSIGKICVAMISSRLELELLE